MIAHRRFRKNDDRSHIAVSLAIITIVVLLYVLHLGIYNLVYSFYVNKPEHQPKKELQNLSKVLFQGQKIYKREFHRNIGHDNKNYFSLHNSFRRKPYPIVPNLVHYLRMNEPEFTFIDAVSILSVYRNHVPSKIYIHTSNSQLSGPFWEKIRATKGLRLILKVVPIKVPNMLGQNNTLNFLKLQILKRYGGIVLDNDMFIVNNLDKYLAFEMTLQWNRSKEAVKDQIIIASKNSRFLLIWLKAYKKLSAMPNRTFDPLEFVTEKMLNKYHEFVYVERLLFIHESSVALIYNKIWLHWHKNDVIWLMQDFLKLEVKTKLSKYIQNTKDFGDEELKKSNNYTFFHMVKGVYY